MMINNLNSEYNLIKVICIKEYKDYRIGDMVMVLDFNDEYGYIKNMKVYPKKYFIPLSHHRRNQISKIIND